MEKITVNFENVKGIVKPMHAVNNIPASPRSELRRTRANKPLWMADLSDAKVPFSRYHDTGGAFGGCKYVDIPNIFRNFDADENDPNSYDFVFTDWLIKTTIEGGVKPFYRLGVTIENDYKIKAYHIYPPKDYKKWARICEHIIMHYNEGWADGFYYDIKYWEIWNEPDNGQNPMGNPMWRGTKEQFFELYEVASNYLKNRFPNIKVGGYSGCGFYKIADLAVDPNANVSAGMTYFVDFFHDFMKYISSEEHKSPLDFFSWHSYSSSPTRNALMSNYVREQLDLYGYPNCENICNEWNPGPRNNAKLIDASHIGANMIGWQKSALDMAMYYDAQMSSSYCGLYSLITYAKTKAYYTFVAFGKMYDLGNEVESSCSDETVQVLGAKGANGKAIMIVNDSDKEKEFTLEISGANACEIEFYAIDETKNLEKVEDLKANASLKIPAYAVYYLEVR